MVCIVGAAELLVSINRWKKLSDLYTLEKRV
jgi:hypothetical protein